MGFLTPMHELGEYLKWTRSGEIQLPDFQRGYKWEDERKALFETIRKIQQANASADPDQVMEDVLQAQQAVRAETRAS